jgi:transcriptional regulator with XRE-family HTH domain
MLEKTVKPVDKLIGRNIRAIRLARGFTQEELALRIGITFQQVQKYEKGANRVGGSRLVQMAEAMDVPVVALFEGAEIGATPIRNELLDLVANQHAIRLLLAFSKIKMSSSQQALVRLAEEMAALTAASQIPS